MNVRNLLKIKAALSLLLLAATAYSQSYYNFSTSNKTYADVPGSWTISTDLVDENYILPLLHPLTFFGEKTGNYLAIGKNAFITTTGPRRSLAFDPLTMRLSKRDSTSSISYKTDFDGTDSVLIIQWKNMKLDSGLAGDYINMQCRLYYTSQAVEFHYGPSQILSPRYADSSLDQLVGVFLLSQDFYTAYDYNWLYGNPTSPSVSYDPDLPVWLIGLPPNGTVYRFEKKSSNSIHTPGKFPITLYPNPATDKIFIETTDGGTILNAYLTSAAGQALTGFVNMEGGCSAEIALLPPGVYFITVETADGTSTQKFIKR